MSERVGNTETLIQKRTMGVGQIAAVMRVVGHEEFLELPDDTIFMTHKQYADATRDWQPYDATKKEEDRDFRCRPGNPHGIEPDLFFPEKGGSTVPAKTECARCFMSAACLSYALENGEQFGVWGGVSERDRRVIKRRMMLNR